MAHVHMYVYEALLADDRRAFFDGVLSLLPGREVARSHIPEAGGYHVLCMDMPDAPANARTMYPVITQHADGLVELAHVAYYDADGRRIEPEASAP